MKLSRVAIVTLALTLAASNGWWAFKLAGAWTSVTHYQQEARAKAEALERVLAILPVVVKGDTSPDRVLAAAYRSGDTLVPCEQGGVIWLRQLGLRFDTQDHLVDAVYAQPRGCSQVG